MLDSSFSSHPSMTDDIDKPALPGFTRKGQTHNYSVLRKFLWRAVPTTSQPADSAEPQHLAQLIQACPADMSLWTDDQGGDATATDVAPPAPQIRYIDLTKNRSLVVHQLDDLDKVIVRQEYVDFMAHADAIAMRGKKVKVFLTGQPGIGKSIGACYFLFRLLASRQSVFFITDQSNVYYISEAGVEVANITSPDMDDVAVANALSRSWVLIDVDTGFLNWSPPTWVECARCLVWTSPPWERRMRHFIKQYNATAWYMKPWTFEEIAAVTCVSSLTPFFGKPSLLTLPNKGYWRTETPKTFGRGSPGVDRSHGAS
ncbi:hypothetical protein BDZ89DRAFT_655214 [Hymenopellis radicata]|nr:hypothetical protein BDZ89DRAFT_655214 [Hymenopellis radicata]